MAADPIRAYYDRAAPFYDLTRRPFLLGRLAGVRALDLREGHRVAEIGAGTGHNIRPILASIGATGSLVLADLSVPMLLRARAKADSANVHCVAADARHLPFTGPFDRILFSYSLSLMPDPLRVLESARQALADDGAVVVADFGPMTGWGPVRLAVKAWLALHNVRPVYQTLRRVAAEQKALSLRQLHLGYTLVARLSAGL